jgi:hypothetical protein
MIICKKCKQEKSFDLFYKNKTKLGYFKTCKKCVNELSRKREIQQVYSRNEKLTFLEKEFYMTHKETGLLISNLGRVYSLGGGKGAKRRAKYLPQTLMNNGYYSIAYNKKRINVHRLVAETFIKNKENKPYVNHLDLNRKNNNSKNLEFCTHLENIKHAVTNDSYAVKLNREKVLEIRNSTKTVNELSLEYNVSKTNIRLILKRKIWCHI